jgi:hypothetical protein
METQADDEDDFWQRLLRERYDHYLQQEQAKQQKAAVLRLQRTLHAQPSSTAPGSSSSSASSSSSPSSSSSSSSAASAPSQAGTVESAEGDDVEESDPLLRLISADAKRNLSDYQWYASKNAYEEAQTAELMQETEALAHARMGKHTDRLFFD